MGRLPTTKDFMIAENNKEIWVTFAGVLDLPVVRAMFDFFQKAYLDGVESIHLLMHSPGGGVNEGVALFNYFSTYPIEIVAYNSGSIASAATIAYLGAKKRITSENAVFMVHRTTAGTANIGNAERLKAITSSVEIDDARTESILKSKITLTEEQWSIHNVADLTLTARQSIECGIAHEIGLFAPKGRLFNI